MSGILFQKICFISQLSLLINSADNEDNLLLKWAQDIFSKSVPPTKKKFSLITLKTDKKKFVTM